MKYYYRFAAAVSILLLTGLAALVILTGQTNVTDDESIIILNETVKKAADTWGDLDITADTGHGRELVILTAEGTVLYDTRKAPDRENITVETAVKKHYPYMYIIKDRQIKGCVILTDSGRYFSVLRSRLIIGFAVITLLFILGMAVFGEYIKRNIVVPFRNMQDFADRVAEGKLDEPLMMDRNNMFGVFSESFDIMREELAASRDRELALQKKERELVASLSHDLKTPITGIKLTTELLRARYEMDSSQMSSDTAVKLGNIYRKAEEIDVLVSDLFSSTLEDLGEFKVNCADISSAVIADIVRKYDDKGLVRTEAIPEVLINTDEKRLSQVIGNIISNSYKYADTAIDISYQVTDFLEMSIHDHGPGVPDDEIDLITNKFYRGRATENIGGSGLGLYIAKMLMDKMGGDMIPQSDGDGLCITLLIPLS